MKKFLLIFGYLILFIICFATLFKMMHWPGAGPLFVMGITLFASVFLPVFFIQRIIANRSPLNVVVNIFGMFSTSSMFMGVLFKMMHWPGAGPMLLVGTLFFVFPTLILWIIQQFREYDRRFSEFWRVVAGSILFSVFLIFWSQKPSRNILNAYVKVEDATLTTNRYLAALNERLVAQVVENADPTVISAATNIHASTVEMLEYVEQVKSILIQNVEFTPEATQDHWMINSKDNYDIPTHMIGSRDSEMGIQLAQQLKLYKTKLQAELNTLPFNDKEKMIAGLGDFGVVTELRAEQDEGYFQTWHEGMFSDVVVSGTLALLSGVQNELLNAELMSLIAIEDRKGK